MVPSLVHEVLLFQTRSFADFASALPDLHLYCCHACFRWMCVCQWTSKMHVLYAFAVCQLDMADPHEWHVLCAHCVHLPGCRSACLHFSFSVSVNFIFLACAWGSLHVGGRGKGPPPPLNQTLFKSRKLAPLTTKHMPLLETHLASTQYMFCLKPIFARGRCIMMLRSLEYCV